MKEYFEQVPTIRYEGKNSKNPLAFKHYNKDEVIMGKKMSALCDVLLAYHVRRNERSVWLCND